MSDPAPRAWGEGFDDQRARLEEVKRKLAAGESLDLPPDPEPVDESDPIDVAIAALIAAAEQLKGDGSTLRWE